MEFKEGLFVGDRLMVLARKGKVWPPLTDGGFKHSGPALVHKTVCCVCLQTNTPEFAAGAQSE